MESKLTLEVNINLRADESLQQIVAYVFGQKLTPEHEKQPAAIEPKPQPAADPEPQPATDPESQSAAETEAKPKRARSKKADPEPQKPLPSNGEVAAAVEAAAEQGVGARAQVSFEEVRQAFFQKLAGHRDEIRVKINELGAPSLSTIEPAKLPDMLNFLNNLD